MKPILQSFDANHHAFLEINLADGCQQCGLPFDNDVHQTFEDWLDNDLDNDLDDSFDNDVDNDLEGVA